MAQTLQGRVFTLEKQTGVESVCLDASDIIATSQKACCKCIPVNAAKGRQDAYPTKASSLSTSTAIKTIAAEHSDRNRSNNCFLEKPLFGTYQPVCSKNLQEETDGLEKDRKSAARNRQNGWPNG
jgi:hypothetical protein